MRFKENIILYKNGDRRIIKKFLIFPMSFASQKDFKTRVKETRFLESVYILEKYTESRNGFLLKISYWEQIKFVNISKDEFISLNEMFSSANSDDKGLALCIIDKK